MDGIPVDIFDELRIDTMDDYKKFIPENIRENFTSKDLAKAAKIPQGFAGTLLNVLLETKTVERVGKAGNAYVYNII